MAIGITILCIFVAFLGYYKSHFIFNPFTVLFLVWGIIVPISSLGLYGVDIPSDKAYLAILLGLLGFLIGGVLGWRPSKYKVVLRKNNDIFPRTYTYLWNKNLLYVLIIISMAYYIYKLILVIFLLKSGASFFVIRKLATSQETNELRTSAFIIAVQALIASPTSFLMVAIMPIELLKKDKKDRFLLYSSIALMLLWVITSGGRWVVMWFISYFACVFLMKKKTLDIVDWKCLIRKFRMHIIIGISFLFGFLLYMTFSRKGRDVNLIKELYVYLVAPVPFFSHHMENIDKNYTDMFGYGVSSFYGFLYPFFFIIRLIIGSYPNKILDIYYMSFYMLEKSSYIGGNIYMNAYVTAFYQPYLDGRLLGVFVILFVLGYITCKSFYLTQHDSNMRNMLIYLLLFQKIMFSFVRFYFTMQPQGISFLLALLVVKKKSVDSKITYL